MRERSQLKFLVKGCLSLTMTHKMQCTKQEEACGSKHVLMQSFKHMYVPGFPEPFENFEAIGVNHVQDYFACHWLNKLRLNKKPLIGNMGFPPKQWLPRARTSVLLKSREGKKAVLEKTPTGKPRQTELWKCQLIFGETWFKFFSISRQKFRPYSWYYSNLEESRCSRSATLT